MTFQIITYLRGMKMQDNKKEAQKLMQQIWEARSLNDVYQFVAKYTKKATHHDMVHDKVTREAIEAVAEVIRYIIVYSDTYYREHGGEDAGNK